MKKVILLLLNFLILLPIFTLVTPPATEAGDKMMWYFYSNNRTNVIWEVGYRYIDDYREPAQDYRSMRYTWVNSTLCVNGNRCRSGVFDLNEQRPYALQWGTSCVDPIVRTSVVDEGPYPDPSNVYFGTGWIDITKNHRGIDWFEANGGGNIPFGSSFADLSRCPVVPTPSMTNVSITTNCTSADEPRIRAAWNDVNYADYYDIQRRRYVSGAWTSWTPSSPDTLNDDGSASFAKAYIVGAENSLFQIRVRAHTLPYVGGPTAWDNSPSIRTPYCTPYNISGRMFIDTNSDGDRDTGEPGYTATARRISSSGKEDYTDINNDGIYRLTGFLTGTYNVTASIPPGYVATSPNPRSVRVNNANSTGNDFGIRLAAIPTYEISGRMFVDTNGNGVWDSALGEVGYTATSQGISTTGSSDNTNGLPTCVGACDGTYSLTGLLNSTYSVSAVIPAGYVPTSANPINGIVVNNANVTNRNFGIRQIPNYTISGYVFRDDNGDGIKNGTEPFTTGTIGISGQPSMPTDASGAFTTPLPGLLAGNYTVSLTNNLSAINWEATYPIGIPPSTNVSLGPCSVASFNSGLPVDVASCVGGNIENLTFGIRPIPPVQWTQGAGGDMRADTSLNNQIPTTVPAASRFFSISNSPSTTLLPGIAFGTGLNLGNNGTDNPSLSNPNNWYVNVNYTGGVIRTSYAFIENTLNKNGATINSLGSPNISSVPSSGVYSYSGNVTFDNGATGFNFNGGSYVFLIINGDININSNITVPPRNTVFFITTGDINVAENVVNIQGIFSADDSFVVEGGPDPTANQPLEIQGNVIGNAAKGSPSGYSNNRNLDTNNATTPSVSIIYRPDFVLFAPEFIRYTNYTIKEIAPGSN